MVADSGRPHPFTAPEPAQHLFAQPPISGKKTGPADGETRPLMHQRAHIRTIAVHRKPVGFGRKRLIRLLLLP